MSLTDDTMENRPASPYRVSPGRFYCSWREIINFRRELIFSLDLSSSMIFINTMEATIEFSPAIPLPAPFDVQKRIQELRSYLDPNNPNYQPEQQHTNIKATIKLYEDGKIDGMEQVFIKDGKIVPKEEIFKGPSMSMSEGRFHQFAGGQAYAGTQSWR